MIKKKKKKCTIIIYKLGRIKIKTNIPTDLFGPECQPDNVTSYLKTIKMKIYILFIIKWL